MGLFIAYSNIDYWIYGHSHWNIDRVIGNTKCVSNQLGYLFFLLPILLIIIGYTNRQLRSLFFGKLFRTNEKRIWGWRNKSCYFRSQFSCYSLLLAVPHLLSGCLTKLCCKGTCCAFALQGRVLRVLRKNLYTRLALRSYFAAKPEGSVTTPIRFTARTLANKNTSSRSRTGSNLRFTAHSFLF